MLCAGGIVIYDSVFSNIAVGAGFGFLTITEGEMRSILLLQLRPATMLSSSSHTSSLMAS